MQTVAFKVYNNARTSKRRANNARSPQNVQFFLTTAAHANAACRSNGLNMISVKKKESFLVSIIIAH